MHADAGAANAKNGASIEPLPASSNSGAGGVAGNASVPVRSSAPYGGSTSVSAGGTMASPPFVAAGGSSGGNASQAGNSGTNGLQSPVLGSCAPTMEACDNADNDCDGRVDEELAMTCGPQEVGSCRSGRKKCDVGTWGACEGAVEPLMEVCDTSGEDENCNGAVNEGCACTAGMTRPCGKTMGACKAGAQACLESGQWSEECAGESKRSSEVCDGREDEDCDGTPDSSDSDCECINGKQESCIGGKGICAEGNRQCVNGKWGICESKMTAGREQCDRGGLDEDCDGASNEDCQCTDGDPPMQCGMSNKGVCRFGTARCSNGRWGACTGNVDPARSELCNGLDDDCDGVPDDSAKCPNSGDVCENGSCVAPCKIPPESTYMNSCRYCDFNQTTCVITCTECATDHPPTMWRRTNVTWNLRQMPCTTGISNCGDRLLCSGSLCPWDQP